MPLFHFHSQLPRRSPRLRQLSPPPSPRSLRALNRHHNALKRKHNDQQEPLPIIEPNAPAARKSRRSIPSNQFNSKRNNRSTNNSISPLPSSSSPTPTTPTTKTTAAAAARPTATRPLKRRRITQPKEKPPPPPRLQSIPRRSSPLTRSSPTPPSSPPILRSPPSSPRQRHASPPLDAIDIGPLPALLLPPPSQTIPNTTLLDQQDQILTTPPSEPPSDVLHTEQDPSTQVDIKHDQIPLQPIIEIPPANQNPPLLDIPQIEMHHVQQSQNVNNQQLFQSPPPHQAYVPPPQEQPQQPWWDEQPKIERDWSVWKLACKMRVWEIRRRYSPETIRSVVAQEAHDYFAAHGFPPGYGCGCSHAIGEKRGRKRERIQLQDGDTKRRKRRRVTRIKDGDENSPVDEEAEGERTFMHEEYYDWEIRSEDGDEDSDEEIYDEDEDDEDEDDEDDEDDYEDDDEPLESTKFEYTTGQDGTHLNTNNSKESYTTPSVTTPPHPSSPLSTTIPTTSQDSGYSAALADPSFNPELSSPRDAQDETNPDVVVPPLLSSFYIPVPSPTPLSALTLPTLSTPLMDSSDDTVQLDPLASASSSSSLSVDLTLDPTQSRQLENELALPLESQSQPQTPLLQHQQLPLSPQPQLQHQSPQSIPPPTPSSQTPPHLPLSPILPLPPPPLASVRVYALKHLDLGVQSVGGAGVGKGTPVDKVRAAAWGNANVGTCFGFGDMNRDVEMMNIISGNGNGNCDMRGGYCNEKADSSHLNSTPITPTGVVPLTSQVSEEIKAPGFGADDGVWDAFLASLQREGIPHHHEQDHDRECGDDNHRFGHQNVQERPPSTSPTTLFMRSLQGDQQSQSHPQSITTSGFGPSSEVGNGLAFGMEMGFGLGVAVGMGVGVGVGMGMGMGVGMGFGGVGSANGAGSWFGDSVGVMNTSGSGTGVTGGRSGDVGEGHPLEVPGSSTLSFALG